MWIFFPTLADLCGLSMPPLRLDGVSLKGVLTGRGSTAQRPCGFMQYHQSTVVPSKWGNSVVSDQWRLVRGKELYDIKSGSWTEPRHCRTAYPEVVRRLSGPRSILAGNAGHRGGYILRFIWETITKTLPGWTRWMYWETWRWPAFRSPGAKSTGRWRVKFTRPGRYRFELRRWPPELGLSWRHAGKRKGYRSWRRSLMRYGPDEGTAWKETGETKALAPQKAKLEFFGVQLRRKRQEGRRARFFLPMEQTGETDLSACFVDPKRGGNRVPIMSM